MVAAQTDGRVPNIDDCVHLWRQNELQVISDISTKPRRRPDCKVSTAGNYLHGNTDVNKSCQIQQKYRPLLVAYFDTPATELYKTTILLLFTIHDTHKPEF